MPDGTGLNFELLKRALNDDRFHGFLRVGGVASWDAKKLRPSGTTVLVQRGYAVKEPASAAIDILRLLARGVADAAVVVGAEDERLLKTDARLTDTITATKVPYEVLPMYLVASAKSHAHDPQRFEAIWNSIRTIKNSAGYRALESKALQ